MYDADSVKINNPAKISDEQKKEMILNDKKWSKIFKILDIKNNKFIDLICELDKFKDENNNEVLNMLLSVMGKSKSQLIEICESLEEP